MKNARNMMKKKVFVAAIEGVFLAMCAMPAHADDAEALALKTPVNKAEFGLSTTSQSSQKFGEYSGLNKSGGHFLGNVQLRGGDAYGDALGTRRWSLNATDIGLTSRAIGFSVADQGAWNLGIGYDQLQRNTGDGYQTPYLGTMGGTQLTLPAALTPVFTTTRALTAAQLATFQNVDIHNNRENLSVLGGLQLNRNWDVKVDFNHLDQTGAKLMGFGSYGSAAVTGAKSGELVAILPMPTDYKTDTVTAALNWRDENAFATASYFGSFFRDANNGVKFQTFVETAGSFSTMQTMGTAPNNTLHQFNVNGGYTLSPVTKLTGGLSYGRNTQDTPFAYDNFAMNSPSPKVSLDGLVVTTHGDLKLTHQASKDLNLTAGLKYDNRNNRTESSIYSFNAISGGNPSNGYPNTPVSIKKTQLELAGDYKIDPLSKVRVAFNHDSIRRGCDSYAVNALYPAGTNCMVAVATKDNKLGATYKRTLSDALTGNVGYTFARRITDSDIYARAALVSTNGNMQLGAPAASLIQGLNAGDYLGFHPYLNASKKEQTLRAGINWEATDRLSFVVGGKYTDTHFDTQYGVQQEGSSSMNLDGTFAYSENTVVSAYVTQQYHKRDVLDVTKGASSAATIATATALPVPSGATWSNTLRDSDTTIGINLKHNGLMDGKLELLADAMYSLGRSQYNTVQNYSTASLTPGLDCGAPTQLLCGSSPIVRNGLLQFKLTGTYKMDKNAKIAVAFLHQSLTSNDYKYDSMQYMYTPNALMPTNETSGSYSVNMLSATYQYDFK